LPEYDVKRALFVLGTSLAWILGLYLVVRAVAEPFVIDTSDPASYQRDWGGPTLAGVLVVHIVPGIAAVAAMVAVLLRRRTATTD
jgi:hypothetical protein